MLTSRCFRTWKSQPDALVLKFRICVYPNPLRKRGIDLLRLTQCLEKSLAHASGCDGVLYFYMFRFTRIAKPATSILALRVVINGTYFGTVPEASTHKRSCRAKSPTILLAAQTEAGNSRDLSFRS